MNRVNILKFILALPLGFGAFGREASARTVRPANQQAARGESLDGLTDKAKSTLEQGDVVSARELFGQALKRNPKDVTVLTYLGLIADRAGDLAAAERHFALAVRYAPASASARNNYGAVLLRRGRSTQAAVELAASLRLDPNQPSALINLAQIRFAAGRPEDLRVALDLFGKAYALAPGAEVARALIITSLRLGDKAAIETRYKEYAASLGDEPGSGAAAPAARVELGRALLEGGLFGEAVNELSAALAADPANMEAVVALARAHLARKDVPAAGRTLEAAVSRGLDAAPIYAALADVYEAAGRPENAIPAMRLAIAREPRSEVYRFRYGMLLIDTQAPAAAIIRLQEAVKEFPSSSRLWLALGIAQLAYAQTGSAPAHSYEEAVRSFERAIEIDPKFAAAFAYLGITYAERGEYDQALTFYERAIGLDERLAVAYHLAAEALTKKQVDVDTARVEGLLRRALGLDPSLTPARVALAQILSRTERLAEAAAHLEQAVRFNLDLAEAHYQLMRIYQRLKRPADAQKALATFKRLSERQKEQSQNERRELVRRLADIRF